MGMGMGTQNATKCVVLLKQRINNDQFINRGDNTFCAIQINMVLMSIRQNECTILKKCFNFKLVPGRASQFKKKKIQKKMKEKYWILVEGKRLKCDTSVNFLLAAKQKRSSNWKLIAVHVKKKRSECAAFFVVFFCCCFYCKSFSDVSMHPNGLGSIVGV